MAIVLIKYKPTYKVSIQGMEIGYVTDKQAFETRIKDEVENKQEENLIGTTIKDQPIYELKLVDKNIETNDDVIIAKLYEESEKTYLYYSINLDGENKACVKNLDEAEKVISEIKEEYKKDLELDITVQELYTNCNNEESIQIASAETAKTSIEDTVEEKVETIKKEEEKKASTVNGVHLAVTPVTGRITSRFGSRESIRTSAHKGIDIAAPSGTDIKAAADGKVIYAQYNNGGYGNLVVIDHGNNVKTYYGHCSKIYTSKGKTVKAGDIIAAVGTTGRSTGNHLHFEIRLNDAQVNPQKYIYK